MSMLKAPMQLMCAPGTAITRFAYLLFCFFIWPNSDEIADVMLSFQVNTIQIVIQTTEDPDFARNSGT
jgi:hypothetical protein